MCFQCVDLNSPEYIQEHELEGLPYKTIKWLCFVDGCTSFSRVRDYGLYPLVHWTRAKSSNAHWRKKEGGVNIGTNWFSIHQHYRICGKHWDQYKRYQVNANEMEELVKRTVIYYDLKYKSNATKKEKSISNKDARRFPGYY